MADDPTVIPDADAADETELASVVYTDAKGEKVVPLSALIGVKRENKAFRAKISELEPVAARVKEVNDRLDRATPIVDAILNNPRLKAEAMRIAAGTHRTPESVEQPDAEDDPDAAAHAEDSGYYLADGTTPDVARARRILNRLDNRHGRKTQEAIRPFAGLAISQQVDTNVRAMMARTDNEGVPLATEEGIREAIAGLGADGQRLLANPQVAEVILINAIGQDRMKGRTPKPADDPIWMPHAGSGRRQPTEATLSASEKQTLERLGLTEKEYHESSKRLEANAGNRRGLVLGK